LHGCRLSCNEGVLAVVQCMRVCVGHPKINSMRHLPVDRDC
jgi:hypothetical protein